MKQNYKLINYDYCIMLPVLYFWGKDGGGDVTKALWSHLCGSRTFACALNGS